VIPTSVRQIVEAAKADLAATLARHVSSVTYEDFYNKFVDLVHLDDALRSQLDKLWREELFDRLVVYKPPFEEIFCIDMAQRAVLYPYREVPLAAEIAAAVKTMGSMTAVKIVPVKRGHWRVIKCVSHSTYRSYGWSASRYQGETLQYYVVPLEAAGLKVKTMNAADHPEFDVNYFEHDRLILSNAPAWQIDHLWRKASIEAARSLDQILAADPWCKAHPTKPLHELYADREHYTTRALTCKGAT
jgi:hypothetical protein